MPELKELMCTVGHTALTKIMYPPDALCQCLFYTDVVIVDGAILASREQNSWKFFQVISKRYKKTKLGIAFDHRYTTSKLLSDARQQLKTLEKKMIHSYGLLNIIRKPDDLRAVMRSMKPVVEKLKKMQGSDPEKRTVVALGSYDYSGSGFMKKYKKIFANVVNNFKADAVIAISSVGEMEDDSTCYAVPPNVVVSPMPRFPSLATHWPLVHRNTSYTNDKIMVGLSFEMRTLIYVLQNDAPDLNSSAYAKCKDYGTTSRDAICGQRRTVDPKAQFLDFPYMTYATFARFKTKRHAIFAEHHTSTRDKFAEARKMYGSIRRRVALMLFNIHLGGRKEEVRRR
ncbi:hypothetical protein MTO96_035591 [Rhipicephalus appendiculatus]